MKKVLFYGRIFQEQETEVKAFLDELIRCLLLSDFQIITREGTSTPENYDTVWLDNIVLDISCAYRDAMGLPYECVMSYIMDDDSHESPHNRVKKYLSSTNRLIGYQEMLDDCDVVIGLGGTEGVYRLGLFAAGTKKMFIPFALANGTAKQLVKEFKSLIDNNYSSQLYSFISKNELNKAEIAQFVRILDTCINNNHNKADVISQEDFFRYIDEHPEQIKDFPAGYTWKLLKKLPLRYWIISITAVIVFVFSVAMNIYQTYVAPIIS